MQRSSLVLLALGLALSGSGEVAAAPAWLELRWPEQAGCPTRDEVEAATLRLIAGDTPQPVAAEAVIRADAAGYTLQLHVRDAGGEQRRTLHSPRCQALADATAVILAVAAAPIGVAGRLIAGPPPPQLSEDDELDRMSVPPPAPGPAATRTSSVSSASASPAASTSSTASTTPAPSTSSDASAASPSAASPPPGGSWRRPGLALGVAAAAGLGPTARFAPGLSASVSLLWRRARLDLRGGGWFPSAVRLSGRPDVGAELRLAAGALRGGPRVVRGSIALEPGAGIELGALLAEGFGLETNDSARGLWAAGLLALGVRWRPLRWISLAAEVEGLLAFTRRQYTVAGAADPFYKVPLAGLRLGGGIAVHIF